MRTDVPKEDCRILGGQPNSDFHVDVIKSIKIEHISYPTRRRDFRGLHDVADQNYGRNAMRDFITCIARGVSVRRFGARLLKKRPGQARRLRLCNGHRPVLQPTR